MDIYRIDFSDPTIPDVFEEFSSNLGDAFYQFIENMRCYSKGIGYKPINDFLNEVRASFFQEFKEYVEKTIRQWKESECCLSKLASRIGGGQEAEHYALTYVDRIEHSIIGIFNKDIPEIHENISAPDVSKDSILKINDEIDILLQKLEDTKGQMEQECESKGRENQVFNLIKPLFSEIVQGLYDWMKSNKKSVIEGADKLEKELQYLLSDGNVHDDPASIYSEAVIWNTV